MKAALYRLANKVLKNFGVVVIPKRKLGDQKSLMAEHDLLKQDVLRLSDTLSGGLRGHLIDSGKTRWLEIGCGGTLEKGFYYIDTFPEGIVDRAFQGNYSRVDIVNASSQQLEALGKFDLIRMQHVFEHFAPEDGRRVLERCALLLNPAGYLLISTPDLRVHATAYLTDAYKDNRRMESFSKSARRRVADDAPNSFYFSVFAHSLLHERHLWCYDVDGIRYLLNETGSFDDIQELTTDHPWASFPFTHNRPDEDVCVLARKK